MNADLIPDLTVKVPLRPWHDYRGWSAELATDRNALLRWIDAAGGVIEGGTATLPNLPPGPARTALAAALLTAGIESRAGAAFRLPDFGAEVRARGLKPDAKLVIRFALVALADRGHERVVTGRVDDGAAFSITVTTSQPEAEIVAMHRRRGALRVEGGLCPVAFKRRDSGVVPIRGVVLAGA